MIIIKLKESRRSLGSGNADKNGTEACKRMSKQRKKILDLVKSGRLGHPTAAEVYDEVRKSMPNISLGTVYRNLNMLADDGDISGWIWGTAAYRGLTAKHRSILILYAGVAAAYTTPQSGA